MSQPMDLEQYRAGRDRVGQGTMVEQSRAAAEVYAAMMAAQQLPRVEARAVKRLEEACRNPEFAKRAFFSFRRGGSSVHGPTIHLAKEAARHWGNLHHGLAELRRDDEFRQSEMQAWAWDLESNQRVSSVFIVPHARWADGAAKPLEDFRDVYENNTNNGARRLREMIFSVLPSWYVEVAKNAAMNSVVEGDGRPLAVRAADAVKHYEGNGVTRQQLEDRQQRPTNEWTPHDLAALEILYGSLSRGEITKDEAFPQRLVTEDDIRAQGVSAGATRRPPRYGPVADPPAEEAMPAGVVEDDADGRTWPAVAKPGGGA